ncbi:MAG: enoyl-CoA hydratase/isomerase family protein [Solirubrobacterales bacterium]|nr:enoyl-CoA hydratase/isomerase family protein [Solirubrobacterales bacterium]HMT04754.1 enoyl-CoA hydratase/isomerase family protein [Solirubrobacterales bacterium]
MSAEKLTPPELKTIQIEIDGNIGTVTLNRPETFNAMSPDLIADMVVAFAWLADEAPLRGLIVTGTGAAFCAGGDLNWFKSGMEDDSIDIVANVRRGADVLHQAIVDLQRIPYPVIAALNGPTAGAGFSLALACDIRICSESAFLACAYGRIGVSPDGGMTYFLPRVVGPSRAIEILLNDPNLTPADALAEGLVSEVVAPEDLLDRARAKADKLATKSPYYQRMAKKLVHQSLDNSLTEQLELERHSIAEGMGTRDAMNAVGAFLSGGKAEFKGE